MILATQRSKRRRIVVPRGSLADGDPPFAAVEHLDAGKHGKRHLGAIAIALSAHLVMGVAVLVQHVTTRHPPPRVVHQEIVATVQRAPPKPPPPPPAPKPVREARAPRPVPRAPPPAPAQAGKVISAEPNGPADLTSFDLVVGQGHGYAGGASSAGGTSKKAVELPPAPRGVPDAPAVDRSRTASALGSDWACAWPDEAQDSDLRDARVTIRVSVDRDGAPEKVEVMSAPPGGFADAARRCALSQTFRTARDVRGDSIAAQTLPFNVHFVR